MDLLEGDKSDCHRYLRASLAQRHHTCMSDRAVTEKPHIRRWRNGLKWLVLPTDLTERALGFTHYRTLLFPLYQFSDEMVRTSFLVKP